MAMWSIVDLSLKVGTLLGMMVMLCFDRRSEVLVKEGEKGWELKSPARMEKGSWRRKGEMSSSGKGEPGGT